MEPPPPVKPPRGVKPIKETSGLLMSVIRTLSSSETNEQRDKEKAKLEAEYKVSDRKLDQLISDHESDLNQVMQLFGNLSTQIYESKAKIQKVKESLKACKTKLNCKRDKLKKLWEEFLEHKYIIQFLEEIEKINEIPNEVTSHLTQKRYLSATRLLVQGVSLSKGNLENVEGLKELTLELNERKEELHLQILQELKHHLYVKPSQNVLALRRQESGKDGLFSSSFRRSNELRSSARQRTTARRNIFETSKNLRSKLDEFEVEENIDKQAAMQDSQNFIAVLVKCLALLEKLPYGVNAIIKIEMEEELRNIVHKTTIHVNDFISLQNGNETKLTEFVQTLFEEFKEIAHTQEMFLGYISRAIAAHKLDFQPYDMKFYWNTVENVLKMVLNDYLDIQNISSNTQPNNNFGLDDISLYFSRRKTQTKKKTMFKFDYANTAMVMNNFSTNANTRLKEKALVCPGDSNNIMTVFIPFICFTEEIEQALNLSSGTHCKLYDFLYTNARDHFLSIKTNEIEMKIYDILKSADAWKTTLLLDVTTDYKPLLLSTLNVEKCINEWQSVLKSLPLFSECIVENVYKMLLQYKEKCKSTYQSIVQPDDRRICSAAWLKDADISRFLKSLPNWVNLKAQQESCARNDRRRIVRREHTLEEESPEDVRQRNRKEAEILAGNLGEGGINSSEILSDMNLLKELAQLQESMEWFSVRVFQFASEFRKEPNLSPIINGNSNEVKPNISTGLLKHLTDIGQEFDELANTCLLLLHLEVRVQCFHYLLAQNDYNKETHEPDPKVLELSRVLANVDEAMTSSLHPRKCKYIFEGIGHLIAKILISSCQYMQVIDESAIQRMSRNVFALQQTLTNITMTREVALDYARHYFELFFLTPEEILNDILERGAEYSELEYMNALQLLHRSKTKNFGNINSHMQKLSNILEQVGVTV